MEHVDGCDLGAALRFARDHGTALDPLVCAFIAMETCEALDYAQQPRGDDERARPLVHRDITPSNLLLSRSGEVKVADFGIALRETAAGGNALRGTPAYMSPEQALSQPVDVRSDLFALGLVLYEALAGERAYPGDNARETLAIARRGHAPAPPDSAPAPLREIVARATATAPDDRYQNARQMQLALDRYLIVARSEGDRQPPGIALADWLKQMLEQRQVLSSPPDSPEAEASVRTFLDDGIEGVVSFAGTRVETAAETAAETAPQTVMETSVSHAVDTPRRRWGVWAAAIAGGLAAVAGAAVALSGSDSPRDREPERTVAATTADAGEAVPSGPAIDAARAVAAAPPRPVVDGGRIAIDALEPRVQRRGGGTSAASPTEGGGTPPGIDAAPPPPRPPRRAPPRQTSPAAGELGVIKVSCQPWAKVNVAGRGEGCPETPCTLSLPPGRHTLHLSNPVSRFAKTVQVDVVSGETRYVKEALTAPE
jgi:hypothetical protein